MTRIISADGKPTAAHKKALTESVRAFFKNIASYLFLYYATRIEASVRFDPQDINTRGHLRKVNQLGSGAS